QEKRIRKRNAGKRRSQPPRTQNGARVAPRSSGLRRPPLAGALACRRSTTALAKGTHVAQGAAQARLPGTRPLLSGGVTAPACPSPVSTSRAGRSAGRHDAQAARERTVSSRPRAPHSLRLPEYLRERRPSPSEIWHM